MNTSTRPRILGVLRELLNSPNRETDDALLLNSVLNELEHLGLSTKLMTPEEFDEIDPNDLDLIIPMCESYPRLMRLAEVARRSSGPLIINPPEAVLNCYRSRMTTLLSRLPGVKFPPFEMRCVQDGPGEPPRTFEAPQGWWFKRGDVHNTTDHDVVRVRDWSQARRVLEDFQSREITHCVVQPHIPGDLIKFYGVGPGKWSSWFYHDPAHIHGFPFETEELTETAAAAASAVGLEIFGGDVIVTTGRTLTLIDINSWPSFAKVRGGASPQIAKHLRAKLISRENVQEKTALSHEKKS